ncbi:MAG: hypothetical protein A2144_03790 [Chloroflexi bacterium RBG_16_50_9]|nr:MAG: hypothetical protein A2144_03790 [Chloroflexi bacterium RBG_16_50_9]
MNILITGSSGMIGTRLYERLLNDYGVIGLDIRLNKWQPEYNHKLKMLDLRRPSELEKLTEPVDLVVHLAANARVYDLVKNPDLALDNMLINFNTLEYMRKKGIRKIIFASSREVYGNLNKGAAISEADVRLENCESPYAASKVAGEALVHAYCRAYGIDFVIVRFSNVYGMYDDSDRVIPLWIRQCLGNEEMAVFGVMKSLDFTYIDDTVNGIIRIIERFDRVSGNTFNIAYGREVALFALAGMLKSLLGSRSGITLSGNRPGEVWKFKADISRARELLDFWPEVGIDEGLKRTLEWYRNLYLVGRAKQSGAERRRRDVVNV